MSVLNLTTDIWTQIPHRAFGLLLTPTYTIHDDFDAIFSQKAVERVNAWIDPNSKLLMGRPTPIFRDTLFGGGEGYWVNNTPAGFTANWHDDVIDPDTGKRCLLMDDANAGVTGQIYTAWTLPRDTAYFVKVVKGLAPQDAPHTPDECYFWLSLGWDAGNSIAYRIEARMGEPFRLMQTEDGNTWEELRSTKDIPDAEAYLEANNRVCLITVLPCPERGTISIYIGDGEGDLSFTTDPALFPADVLKLETKNGKCRVGFYPMGHPIAWSLTSGAHEIGFTPRSDPFGRVWPDGVEREATASTPATHPYPAGTDAAITVLPDENLPTLVRFKIDGTGTQKLGWPAGYGERTVKLEWGEVEWPAVRYNDTFDIPQKLTDVHVVERHFLDWNNLNYVRQATIECDNYYGEWSFSSGMRAVSIARGYDGQNALGFVGWLGSTIDFHRADPDRGVTFQAFDRSFPLRRRKCGVLPPLDAWCPYAAERFLAQIGGVTEEWLTYIPACQTGRNPPNCPHPLLPAGTGNRPRLKPNPQAPLWTEMNRIRALYRHILGFDIEGNLRFEPYDPLSFPFFGWFSLVPEFDPEGQPYLNEITGGITTRVSVDDVRSQATLIGIDPTDWTPLIVHENNDDVVFDPNQPGFLGFFDPWVEIDPIFTSLSFMREFAALMKAQTSLPTVSTQYGAHLQPGLGVAMQMGVHEPLTLGSMEFFTTGLTHAYGQAGEQTVATTSIQAKALANFL